MDRRVWSLQDAKNSFSTVVAAASDGFPQTVTKRGKPAVAVPSIAAYQELCRRRPPATRPLVDHLLAMPKDDGSFDRIDIEPRA